MKRNDPISHLMTRNVITVHHGDPISKVRSLVREHGVHHLPVVSGDQLIGQTLIHNATRERVMSRIMSDL